METRDVTDLARDLLQASDTGKSRLGERGRAVLLVGAGCSISAGIKPAAGVAQFCATELHRIYGRGWSSDASERPASTKEDEAGELDAEVDPDVALEWLVGHGYLPEQKRNARTGQYDWGALYSEFFENHLKAPNAQRDVISKLVEKAGDRINWTHACIGELVARRVVHTVLTTNFDQLVVGGIVRAGVFPVVADGPFSFNRILGQPLAPQVVHLHGSMHTYNLRNSRKAVARTKEDQGTLAMVHTLLQQCNVLVIVGYAGGEEGLMEILIEAAGRLEDLVVYWIAYERGSLSTNATRLLKGENKFLVIGGDSDKFFSELLSSMRIGSPAWIGDPIRHLVRQRELLTDAKSGPDYVNAIVRAFGEQLERAIAGRGRPDDVREAYYRALSHHAAGDYAEVLQELADCSMKDGEQVVRLRATAAQELAQRGATIQRDQLATAIQDFEKLLADTKPPRTSDLRGLVKVLQLRNDTQGDKSEEETSTSKLIDDRIGEYLPLLGKPVGYEDKGSLLYSQATARMELLENAGVEDKQEEEVEGKEQDEATTSQRRQEYEKVITLLKEAITLAAHFEVEGETTLEAREALAGALQARASLGQAKGDGTVPRELAGNAVDQLEKVKMATLRLPSSAEYAGLLHNIANALAVQWDLSEGTQRGSLRQRGLEAASAAADAFERLGNTQQREQMESLIVKFRNG